MKTFPKDPDAVLDYKFDWSDWLDSGETISTQDVAADTGVAVASTSITDSGSSVTAWVSGGMVRTIYKVRCRITTTHGRTDDRTIKLDVQER